MWRSLWIACQAFWRGASREDLHLKKICPESANGVETGVLPRAIRGLGRWVGRCAHGVARALGCVAIVLAIAGG